MRRKVGKVSAADPLRHPRTKFLAAKMPSPFYRVSKGVMHTFSAGVSPVSKSKVRRMDLNPTGTVLSTPNVPLQS